MLGPRKTEANNGTHTQLGMATYTHELMQEDHRFEEAQSTQQSCVSRQNKKFAHIIEQKKNMPEKKTTPFSSESLCLSKKSRGHTLTWISCGLWDYTNS